MSESRVAGSAQKEAVRVFYKELWDMVDVSLGRLRGDPAAT